MNAIDDPTTLEELIEGLTRKAPLFADSENNRVPASAPEHHCYAVEGAMQHGFEAIDNYGDVFVCSARQIVNLVVPYRDEIKRLREELNREIEDRRKDLWVRVAANVVTRTGTTSSSAGLFANEALAHFDKAFLREGGVK